MMIKYHNRGDDNQLSLLYRGPFICDRQVPVLNVKLTYTLMIDSHLSSPLFIHSESEDRCQRGGELRFIHSAKRLPPTEIRPAVRIIAPRCDRP
jgi:hypothetical protein